jgi:hypothetical protein
MKNSIVIVALIIITMQTILHFQLPKQHDQRPLMRNVMLVTNVFVMYTLAYMFYSTKKIGYLIPFLMYVGIYSAYGHGIAGKGEIWAFAGGCSFGVLTMS